MTERNTREAPSLDRCTTCGATEIDGRGNVKPLHGHLTCKRCRGGAQDLVKHSPEEWRFGSDGRLQFIGEHSETYKAEDSDSLALYLLIRGLFEGTDKLEVKRPPAPRMFTAVVLPNGYRWHFYPQHIASSTGYEARLFDPARRDVLLHLACGKTLDDVRHDVPLIVQHSLTGDLAPLIEAHVLDGIGVATEIANFDPTRLLKG